MPKYESLILANIAPRLAAGPKGRSYFAFIPKHLTFTPLIQFAFPRRLNSIDAMSESNVQPVLVLVRDLMFASKILGTAQAIGVSVKMVREPLKLAGEAGRRLIVDLNLEGAIEAAVAWKQARCGGEVVGFVSHVDGETIRKAREAGVDSVMARSEFVRSLEQVLRD